MGMKRETVELVTGEKYFSTDHWQTIWRSMSGGLGSEEVRDKRQIDRIRFIALVAHGGGRNDRRQA